MGALKLDNRRKAFTQKDRKECEEKRYRFRAKKSKHHLAKEPLYIAHEYDRDNPLDKRHTQLDNEAWIDLFDPNLDARAGLYYIQWTDEDIRQVMVGLVTDVLVTLRDIKFDSVDDTVDAKDIFEWVLSDTYAALCFEVGYNPDELRRLTANELFYIDKTLPNWVFPYLNALLSSNNVRQFDDVYLNPTEQRIYRMQ